VKYIYLWLRKIYPRFIRKNYGEKDMLPGLLGEDINGHTIPPNEEDSIFPEFIQQYF
jgi:hypothetical protein